MDNNNIVLEMKNIVKKFPGVLANDNVNFKVKKGTVHALMGENGAGKSTLMNILYGLYEQTSGDVLLNGEKVKIDNPKEAIANGIGMVHQHFMLIPALTVIENIVLGGKNGVVLNLKEAAKKFTALSDKYNMDIDPWAMVSDLAVGERQRVEILKAMYKGAKILILDEPTAVLTPGEVKELFKMIASLKGDGNTIIFISHKLKEVLSISDDITVLRLGQSVATVKGKDTNEAELAELMVGRKVLFNLKKNPFNPGENVIEFNDVCTKSKDESSHCELSHINLKIRKGEIMGIAGVDGNGQDQLIDAMTGLTHISSGSVKLKGVDISRQTPRHILDMGVGHVPADRHKRGMVSEMTIKENMMLVSYCHKPYSKGMFLDRQYIGKAAARICNDFRVKTPSINEISGKLSGGNQQKLVLGREIDRNPDLLIAAHPVRGLDIGATEYVHERLLGERDRGCGILLVSTELEEAMSLSDRLAVMYEGQIMGILDKDEFDTTEIGMMMAGLNRMTDRSKESDKKL